MIFKPVLLQKIVDRDKTQTRRPLPMPYEAGKTYALQPGMARESIGRIRVTSVQEQDLGAIDDADARAEGFADRAAFVAYWTDLYGEFDSSMRVARIEFELIDQTMALCLCCGGSGVEAIA